MKVGAIVLARLDSRRLPGKALRLVQGRPLISYAAALCQRIGGVDEVVLACSDRATDDALEAFAKREGITCVRGSTDDVAGRFLKAMNVLGLDGAVRVNGDSPLNSPTLLERAVSIFRQGKWDLISNVPGRTFPYGMSAEVVEKGAFARAYASMNDMADREHVTKYFYDHPEDFSIHRLTSDRPTWRGVQLAVDDYDDLARLEWILGNAKQPLEALTTDELVKLAIRFDSLRER